mmetsp:Transcript_24738/g.79898  ORF Transcript_24738/g.79898 Transcript_24738/m.79898 type:complete len:373 (+) Transcript_24738:535-1653(+)
MRDCALIDFKVDDVQRLRQLEAGFRARSPQQVWRGQVGAVDGCHIAILAPPPHVPERKKYFVARKNKFALLLIAVADADSRIIYYDISQVPTTHDSLAWATSSLGQQVGRGDLPEPFFFSGDSAFSLSPSMVVPSSGTQFFDDAFDFVQSSEGMPIECAFGILVRRWGMFWRPLAVRFDRLAPLIGAAIRLHNFCIDEGIGDDINCHVVHGKAEVQPGRWEVVPKFDRLGRPVDLLDTGRGPPVAVASASGRDLGDRQRRQAELIKAVKEAGVCRPPLEPQLHLRRRQGRGGRSGRAQHCRRPPSRWCSRCRARRPPRPPRDRSWRGSRRGALFFSFAKNPTSENEVGPAFPTPAIFFEKPTPGLVFRSPDF